MPFQNSPFIDFIQTAQSHQPGHRTRFSFTIFKVTTAGTVTSMPSSKSCSEDPLVTCQPGNLETHGTFPRKKVGFATKKGGVSEVLRF